MGGFDSLEGKISCRAHLKSSESCMKGRHGPVQQIAALLTVSRSESCRAVFKQIVIASFDG